MKVKLLSYSKQKADIAHDRIENAQEIVSFYARVETPSNH